MIPLYFYSSSSGMTRSFVERLGRPAFDLSQAEVRSSELSDHWVLVTPSYCAGNGHNDTLPAPVRSFLSRPHTRRLMVGIIGSGNRNFGEHYQKAARDLSRLSDRPILFEFELMGTPDDVTRCNQILQRLDERITK